MFDALALLSCSRYGLMQSELLQILEWCGHTSVGTYDWTVIAHAAGSALSRSSDGSIYIASHSLQQVITQQLEGWFLTIQLVFAICRQRSTLPNIVPSTFWISYDKRA